MSTDAALTALQHELERLARRVDEVEFRVPGPDRVTRNGLAAELVATIRTYLLARLADLEAPAVVVLVGSTGAGKSTLLTSLAREQVSPAGAVRPTTRTPVVWTHRRHRGRYGDDLLPSFGRGDRAIAVVSHDHADLDGVTVVDTPDLDSVVVANRALAEDLLATADLVVYVTSAQRYADAVPWEVLRRLRDRGVPLGVVLNRVPEVGGDAIAADLRRLLADEGVMEATDHAALLTIAEQAVDPSTGALPPAAVAGLGRWLAQLADPQARARLVGKALVASLESAVTLTRRLVDAVEAERAQLYGLRDAAANGYAAEVDELRQSLQEGRLIQGEVLGRWQDFVGTGELLQVLSESAGRVRAWLRRALGGEQRAAAVRGEARGELVATVVRRADRAATTAAAAWELSPAGVELVTPDLWRAGAATAERAEAAIADWLAELTDLVAQRGTGRRRVAQVASAGVNAGAVALMLAVFAQTGGLTGAEVGITAGAAAMQQRLLEHIFGTAAARALVVEARERLEATLTEVLTADLKRFTAPLAALEPPRQLEQRLDAAANGIAALAGVVAERARG